MPEQLRAESTTSQRQANQKNWNAQQPRDSGNDGAIPWQMHQTPAERVESFRRNRFALRQSFQRGSQRKDEPQPNPNRNWISDRVPINGGMNEALHQPRGAQERIDDHHVVPRVEDAPENLR